MTAAERIARLEAKTQQLLDEMTSHGYLPEAYTLDPDKPFDVRRMLYDQSPEMLEVEARYRNADDPLVLELQMALSGQIPEPEKPEEPVTPELTLSPFIPTGHDLDTLDVQQVFTQLAESDFREFIRQAWHIIEPASPLVEGLHIDAVALHLQAVYESWIKSNARIEVLHAQQRAAQEADQINKYGISLETPVFKFDPKTGKPLDSITSPELFSACLSSLYILPENTLIRDLSISIPPRHGKSTIACVLFPAWVWTRHPGAKFMTVAYAHALTIRDSVRCRRLIESPWYQERWGAVYQLTGDQNTKIRFDNTKGGFRFSTSLNGTIIGDGADFIICDDLNDLGKIHSLKDRLKVQQKHSEVLSTRLNNPQSGCNIVIAQRGHCGDLIGGLRDSYIHLKLPGEFEPENRCSTVIWTDPRTEKDQLLWPDRFNREEMDKLRISLGGYAFAAQIQQNPIPSDGGVFNPDWFIYYTPSQQPDYTTATSSIISVDMNFGSTATDGSGSYVVAQVWCRFGTDYYLMDQIRGQWEYVEARKRIRALWDKWPKIYCVGVEDKANGPALISDLKKEIPCVVAITPKGSKEARARSIAPMCEARKVYIPDPNAKKYPQNNWVGLYFLPEVGAFPKAQNDDQVDSMSQGLNKIRQVMAYGSSGDDGQDGKQDSDSEDGSGIGGGLSGTGRGSLGMGPSRFNQDEDESEEVGLRSGGLFGGRR